VVSFRVLSAVALTVTAFDGYSLEESEVFNLFRVRSCSSNSMISFLIFEERAILLQQIQSSDLGTNRYTYSMAFIHPRGTLGGRDPEGCRAFANGGLGGGFVVMLNLNLAGNVGIVALVGVGPTELRGEASAISTSVMILGRRGSEVDEGRESAVIEGGRGGGIEGGGIGVGGTEVGGAAVGGTEPLVSAGLVGIMMFRRAAGALARSRGSKVLGAMVGVGAITKAGVGGTGVGGADAIGVGGTETAGVCGAECVGEKAAENENGFRKYPPYIGRTKGVLELCTFRAKSRTVVFLCGILGVWVLLSLGKPWSPRLSRCEAERERSPLRRVRLPL
jgi:hypothetical protein